MAIVFSANINGNGSNPYTPGNYYTGDSCSWVLSMAYTYD